MTIYQHIFKAWATLAGFDGESPTFADRELYANGVLIADWNRLYTIKPEDLRIADGYTEGVPKTYEEQMSPENFSYGAFDWNNEHGERVGFSLGNYKMYNNFDAGDHMEMSMYLARNGTTIVTNADNYNNGLGYPDPDHYISLYMYGEYDEGDTLSTDEVYQIDNPYAAFYMKRRDNSNHQEIWNAIIVHNSESNPLLWEMSTYGYWNDQWNEPYTSDTMEDMFSTYDEIFFYFDDGAQLPEGVTWNDTLASYFVPSVKTPTELNLVTSQANEALLGVQIATHVTLWTMGIGCGIFIVALFKLIAKWFSRR